MKISKRSELMDLDDEMQDPSPVKNLMLNEQSGTKLPELPRHLVSQEGRDDK